MLSRLGKGTGGTGRCAAHLGDWGIVWGRLLVVLVEDLGKSERGDIAGKSYREEKWIWYVSKWDLGKLSR